MCVFVYTYTYILYIHVEANQPHIHSQAIVNKLKSLKEK